MDDQDRHFTEYLDSELATAATRAWDHLTTTFQWLMATLFAANGGAIVALFSAETPLPGQSYAEGWFAAGTIFSLLMGTLSAYAGYRLMAPLTATRMRLHQALIQRDSEIAKQALVDLTAQNEITWKTWVPSYAGLGSLACFIIGVIIITAS